MQTTCIWLVTLLGPLTTLGQYQQPGAQRVETAALDWVDHTRQRPVPARLYFPDTGNGPYPVIIFSHGLGGTREGYQYLGRHWASHGYVSVHLQHLGSDDAVWRGSHQPFKAMQRAAFNPANAFHRPRDVRFAIDQMDKLNRTTGPLQGRLDLGHIGVAGHSFGAYTALASVGQAAGRQRSLADPRISAAIPMSAPVPVRPGVDLDTVYRQVRVPVLHLTGTRDDSPLGTTTPAQRRLPFDHGAGHPRYLLVLKDADHMAFSDSQRGGGRCDPRHQEFIRMSTTAFWDAYLKADLAARQWLAAGGLAAALGEAGTFETKP